MNSVDPSLWLVVPVPPGFSRVRSLHRTVPRQWGDGGERGVSCSWVLHALSTEWAHRGVSRWRRVVLLEGVGDPPETQGQ